MGGGGSRALEPACLTSFPGDSDPHCLPAGTGTSHPSGESWRPFRQLHPDLVTAPPALGERLSQSVSFSPHSPHPLLGLGRQEWAGQGWSGLQRPAGLCLFGGFSSLAAFLNKRPGSLWGQSQTHPLMGPGVTVQDGRGRFHSSQSQAILRKP